MNLKSYKKEFSIFVYDENPVQARFLKEALVREGYEAHFYTTEDLLLQAIYLALPHIVVLPALDKTSEMVQSIHKISREIQIFGVGPASEGERLHRLLEQDLIYDYVLDPVTLTSQFTHRIQRGIEAWLSKMSYEKSKQLLQEQKEKSTQVVPTATAMKSLDFIDEAAIQSTAVDHKIGELLLCESEEVAIQFGLKRLQDLCRKNFAYLKYDEAAGTLVLQDVATGMTKKLRHLGLKLEGVEDRNHFFLQAQDFKVWTDFFKQVFQAEHTSYFILKGKEVVHGLLVSLDSLNDDEKQVAQKVSRALSLILDNHFKTRLIFDHIPIELKSFCLNNKYFYEKLNAEISRARRHQIPVAVLSFDVQGETAQHVQQQALLLTKILRRFTRVSDFVGRLSDQKVAVALPHTPLEGAAFVGSRLQRIVQKAFAEKGWNSAIVTCGASCFPSLASDSMSLLEGSEEAASQSAPFEVVLYTIESTTEKSLEL
jgi:GGDEF domain-containing protein